MNNFLGDLINRHQGNSDGRESFKVQPRPKARFENETLTKPNLNNDPSDGYSVEQRTQADTEAGSLMHQSYPNRVEEVGTEKIQATQSALPINQTPDQSSRHASGVDLIDTVNERFNVLSAQVGKKQPAQQESLQATSNQATQQKQQVFNLTEESRRSASTEHLLIGGLNARVQEILQRLQNQQTTPIPNQNGLGLLNEPGSANLGNRAITEPAQTLIQPEIRPEALGHSISEPAQPENRLVDSPVIQQPGLLQIPTNLTQIQTDLNHPLQEIKTESESEPVVNVTIDRLADGPVIQQPGLLQIPVWLTQMQTDLHHRWQEINTKVEAEPVVNVTIGRIEVKAFNADSAKQPTPRNKPTGVMSLDDYLKQRESRERA